MILTREELQQLFAQKQVTAVSVYLPTHRTGDIQEDPIRLRNLLSRAEESLTESGVRSVKARDILEPARRLLEDPFFWQKGDGLALFMAPGFFRHYFVPQSFPEILVIGERFHIKPLLALLSQDSLFYVLPISQNKVRLLQCRRDTCRELLTETMPQSLAESLKYDHMDRELQFHYHATTPNTGGEPMISHGEEVSEGRWEGIRHFMREINRGMQEVLREERSPLLVAAVDYMHTMFREANSYKYLLDTGIIGNPDDISSAELHRQAWKIVEAHLDRARQEAEAQYSLARARGQGASDIREVAAAAYDGRVWVLFVALDEHVWGRFNPETRQVELHERAQPGDVDLLDFAAAHSIIKGGTVYVLKREIMPDRMLVAAVFRYPAPVVVT